MSGPLPPPPASFVRTAPPGLRGDTSALESGENLPSFGSFLPSSAKLPNESGRTPRTTRPSTQGGHTTHSSTAIDLALPPAQTRQFAAQLRLHSDRRLANDTTSSTSSSLPGTFSANKGTHETIASTFVKKGPLAVAALLKRPGTVGALAAGQLNRRPQPGTANTSGIASILSSARRSTAAIDSSAAPEPPQPLPTARHVRSNASTSTSSSSASPERDPLGVPPRAVEALAVALAYTGPASSSSSSSSSNPLGNDYLDMNPLTSRSTRTPSLLNSSRKSRSKPTHLTDDPSSSSSTFTSVSLFESKRIPPSAHSRSLQNASSKGGLAASLLVGSDSKYGDNSSSLTSSSSSNQLLESAAKGPLSTLEVEKADRARQSLEAVSETASRLAAATVAGARGTTVTTTSQLNSLETFQHWVRESFKVRALVGELRALAANNERLELENTLLRRSQQQSTADTGQVAELERNTTALMMKVYELETQQQTYMKERQRLLQALDSTADVLDEQTKANDELSTKAEDLAKQLEIALRQQSETERQLKIANAARSRLEKHNADLIDRMETQMKNNAAVHQEHRLAAVQLKERDVKLRVQQEKMESMQSDLDMRADHIDKLERRAHELLLAKAALEDTITEMNKNKTQSYVDLEKELQRQRNEARAFLNAAGKAQERADTLTREMVLLREEMRAKLDAERQKTKNAEQAHDETKHELLKVRRQLEEANAVIMARDAELKSMSEKLEIEVSEKAAMQIEIDELKKRLEEEMAKITQLKAQLKHMTTRLEQTDAARKQAESQKVLTEEQLKTVQSKFIKVDEELHSLRQAYEALLHKFAKLQDIHRACDDKMKRVKEEAAERLETKSRECEELRQALITTQRALDAQKLAAHKAEKLAADLQAQLNEEKRRNEETTHKLVTAHKVLHKQYEQELATKEQLTTQLSARISNETQGMKSELDKLKAEKAALESKVAAVKADLDVKTREADRFEEALRQTERNVHLRDVNIGKLKDQLDRTRALQAMTEKRLVDLEARYADKESGDGGYRSSTLRKGKQQPSASKRRHRNDPEADDDDVRRSGKPNRNERDNVGVDVYADDDDDDASSITGSVVSQGSFGPSSTWNGEGGLVDQLQQAKRALQNANDMEVELRAELENRKAQLTTKSNEVVAVQKDVTKLKRLVSERDRAMERYRSELVGVSEVVVLLRQQLEEATADAEAARSEVSQLSQSVELMALELAKSGRDGGLGKDIEEEQSGSPAVKHHRVNVDKGEDAHSGSERDGSVASQEDLEGEGGNRALYGLGSTGKRASARSTNSDGHQEGVKGGPIRRTATGDSTSNHRKGEAETTKERRRAQSLSQNISESKPSNALVLFGENPNSCSDGELHDSSDGKIVTADAASAFAAATKALRSRVQALEDEKRRWEEQRLTARMKLQRADLYMGIDVEHFGPQIDVAILDAYEQIMYGLGTEVEQIGQAEGRQGSTTGQRLGSAGRSGITTPLGSGGNVGTNIGGNQNNITGLSILSELRKAQRITQTSVLANLLVQAGLGVRVTRVAPLSPGTEAGLQVGDIIQSIAGRPTLSVSKFKAALSGLLPGDVVSIQVLKVNRDWEQALIEAYNDALVYAKRFVAQVQQNDGQLTTERGEIGGIGGRLTMSGGGGDSGSARDKKRGSRGSGRYGRNQRGNGDESDSNMGDETDMKSQMGDDNSFIGEHGYSTHDENDDDDHDNGSGEGTQGLLYNSVSKAVQNQNKRKSRSPHSSVSYSSPHFTSSSGPRISPSLNSRLVPPTFPTVAPNAVRTCLLELGTRSFNRAQVASMRRLCTFDPTDADVTFKPVNVKDPRVARLQTIEDVSGEREGDGTEDEHDNEGGTTRKLRGARSSGGKVPSISEDTSLTPSLSGPPPLIRNGIWTPPPNVSTPSLCLQAMSQPILIHTILQQLQQSLRTMKLTSLTSTAAAVAAIELMSKSAPTAQASPTASDTGSTNMSNPSTAPTGPTAFNPPTPTAASTTSASATSQVRRIAQKLDAFASGSLGLTINPALPPLSTTHPKSLVSSTTSYLFSPTMLSQRTQPSRPQSGAPSVPQTPTLRIPSSAPSPPPAQSPTTTTFTSPGTLSGLPSTTESHGSAPLVPRSLPSPPPSGESTATHRPGSGAQTSIHGTPPGKGNIPPATPSQSKSHHSPSHPSGLPQGPPSTLASTSTGLTKRPPPLLIGAPGTPGAAPLTTLTPPMDNVAPTEGDGIDRQTVMMKMWHKVSE